MKLFLSWLLSLFKTAPTEVESETMEDKILKTLQTACTATDLPMALDARKLLATNVNATPWKVRDVKALEGMAWHQELGWGTVEGVAKYHTGPKSHLGARESIAYTWAIRRDGQIVLCNDFSKKTWSQGYRDRPGDENAEFMSVMYVGLFRSPAVSDMGAGEPNTAQLFAGLLLWQVCRSEWGWDSQNLYGHFQFGKPSCPGNTLETIVRAVRFNIPPQTDTVAYDWLLVIDRQRALIHFGYLEGIADGLWGPLSKGALADWQLDMALEADGIWGSMTERKMNEVLT